MNIIFLHGLLGTKSDWQKLIEKLPHFHCIALDLPLHGDEKQRNIRNFDETCRYLSQKIQNAVKNEKYFLAGYSLGGRIALYYALRSDCEKGNLQGLVLEGANPGLQNEAERQTRRQHDEHWAQRFADEPAETVLDAWYRQPLFAHLTEAQRRALIQQRKENCGANIAAMLRATGLAGQPDFRAEMRSDLLPVYYFCGEKDLKSRRIATQNQFNLTLISNAGHNAHSENPTEFAEKLTVLLAAH